MYVNIYIYIYYRLIEHYFSQTHKFYIYIHLRSAMLLQMKLSFQIIPMNKHCCCCNDKIKMAWKPGKKQKENPVGYIGEGKTRKRNKKRVQRREDTTETACICVWRWDDPYEVGSHKGQLSLLGLIWGTDLRFDLRNWTWGTEPEELYQELYQRYCAPHPPCI